MAGNKKVLKGAQKALSEKAALVRKEDPSLTRRQAVGKAAGILALRKKRKK